jgi:hypothetical protein
VPILASPHFKIPRLHTKQCRGGDGHSVLAIVALRGVCPRTSVFIVPAPVVMAGILSRMVPFSSPVKPANLQSLRRNGF